MANQLKSVDGAGMSSLQRTISTVCLMLATLVQTLDSTIANVALPYMQGSLSASYDQITWVLTAYVISAAIFTAPVGWLAERFGRKNLLLCCVAGFTVTSMLCGIANSLSEIVVFRFMQGMFGAALVPLSQSTMIDSYPPERRGVVMSIWGMGVMVGPIIGPTLGGYLTSFYNWRFVFFVNLPLGIICFTGLAIFMKRTIPSKSSNFDWLGFAILSIGLAALQIMLDRGEELDWFSSAIIIGSLVVACLGLYLFIVHLITTRNSFIPRIVFADLNFNTALLSMLLVGIVMLASTALMPPFLENLANDPVETAGLIMAPRGAGTMIALMIAGRLSNRVDPRLLMMCGYTLLMLSTYIMEGWTPATSTSSMIITVVIQGAALGLVFLPLQFVAFATLAPELRTQGSSLLNLSRNVGNAVGISITAALLDHQTQYEHGVLAQYITPFARPLQAGGAVSHMLNPNTRTGAAVLDSMINNQAQIIAYADDYKFMFFITLPAMLCLFMMRRPPPLQGPIPAAAE